MRWTSLLLALSASAGAHEVAVEAGSGITTSSSDNPRTGSVSVAGSATWEPKGDWAVFGGVQYTRDLATRTAWFSATGSNIFLLHLGASFTPSDHLLTMLNVTASPPARQVNTSTVTVNSRSADVAIDAKTWSVGGLWSGAWTSAGTSDYESTVDVALGVTLYDVFQTMALDPTTRAQNLRATCATAVFAKAPLCRLIGGVSTPLLQGRLGAGYTATVWGSTDLSVSATYYLYDQDPDQVGFFSLVALGRAELGSGLPILPLQFSLKPSIVHRLGAITLRVAYQLGVYQSGNGLNHGFTGKVTWKTSRSLRLFLALTGQFDASQSEVLNLGGNGVLGALVSW